MFASVSRAARRLAPDAAVALGGSYAKETWLSTDVDIDVFVRLDPRLGREALENVGLRIARLALRGHRQLLRYAEHPYLEGHVAGVRVNVVPCFRVRRGEWQSAADRSPFHTEFVRERLKSPLRTEVRLVKQFLRVVGAYGAEIAVQGFSGYVCEILVLKFGSFVETLRAASGFQPRQVIVDAPAAPEVLRRFHSPLIVPDPVDPRRNLGAAISLAQVGRLILAARSFLARPSLRFFRESQMRPLPSTDPLLRSVVGMLFKHGRVSVDILWGQLRRTQDFFVRQLGLAGYRVLRGAAASDDAGESAFLFLLDDPELPPSLVKAGPPIYRAEDSSRFVQRNRRAQLLWMNEEGRLLALAPRRSTTAPSVLARLTHGERRGSGIAPGLHSAIRSSTVVRERDELVRMARTREWLAQALTRLLRTNALEFGRR